MNVWDLIVQRAPATAFFWISTKAAIGVPSPIVQPQSLTSSGWAVRASVPRRTL